MDEPHPIVGGLTMLIAFASGIFSLWCTYIAFTGGTLPVLGWELEGNVTEGLVWFFLVTPIITTVFYWVAMLLALPLQAVLRGK